MAKRIPSFLHRTRPWHIVVLFCLIYLSVIFAVYEGDIKAFVVPGSNYYPDCPDINIALDTPGGTEEGYDGQFAYYIAIDPTDAPNCMDVPAYRYQRVLLPVLGRLFGLGHGDLVPLVFVVINLLALAGSTALLERLLEDLEVNYWFAITYGLFFGLVISVRLSTTEPLAYGLVVLAIWFARQEHPWLVALALLAAAFTKETIGLFVAGFLLFYALERRWRDATRLTLVVGIPFTLWQLYLYNWLGEFGIGSGGGGASSFEIIPYNGIWRMAYDETGSFLAFVVLGIIFIPSVMLPSLWGLWMTIKEFRQKQYHLYTCLYFSAVIIMPFVPFSTYREFLGIFRFIVGMVMLHILYSALRHPGRPLVYSTLWLVLLLFLVAG